MILRILFFSLFVFVLLFSSCFKEDDPVILPPPGDVQVDQVSMGPDYISQIYYQLSTKEIFVSDHRMWDLAFETTADGFHIWINGSNEILVSNTNSSNFLSITDTTGANWKWDASSWHKDSTAIGNWLIATPPAPTPAKDELNLTMPQKTEESKPSLRVYLLDLGPEMIATERFKKIIFETVDAYQYTFKYSNLNNTNLREITLAKEPAFAYTYFSIRNFDQAVFPEPVKPKWDILFTRYRTVFYQNGNVIPYILTGVLINPDGYKVAIDSTKSFSEVDYNFAKNLFYTYNRDAIGYNWKRFLFTPPVYQVQPQLNYLIQDNAGYYWKLHFIDFYNDQAIKGYPKFEFQRL